MFLELPTIEVSFFPILVALELVLCIYSYPFLAKFTELLPSKTVSFLHQSFQITGVPLHFAWLAIVAGVFAAFLAVFMFPMPDTPSYWLIKHQRHKALAVLEKVRGPHADVDLECREIEATLDSSVR